jgi:tetratricopeptide (TPR) repeat protein
MKCLLDAQALFKLADVRRAFVICLLLVLTTLAAYWPLRFCGFINFDDPLYVTNNPHVFHGLTFGGLRWAFTAMHSANWHPLTWLSHMLDCQIFGDNPPAHHLVNLFFHVAATLLLFWILKRMTQCELRSAFVAGFFALHPLHVESVAWVAERKDVLSGLFFMLTIWAYVAYAKREKSEDRNPKPEYLPVGHNPKAEIRKDAPVPKVRVSRFSHLPSSIFYLLALLLFACGLMSKPTLVTLPFVLLLLDYWPLRRLGVGELRVEGSASESAVHDSNFKVQPSKFVPQLIEKLPFLALSAASCAVTIIAQSKGGAVVSEDMIPFRWRTLNAIVAYATYLAQTVWPHNLAVFYPHPGVWPVAIVSGSLVLLLGISLLVARAGMRRPYLVVGWLWYLGMLVPVIGLMQVGSQAMADRYTYLPVVGIFIMIVWGVADLRSVWPRAKTALTLAGGLALGACLIATNLQVRYWQDSLTLFQHALKVEPESALAQRNLGQALSQWGRQEEAIVHFQKALELKPDFAMAQVNLGDSLNLLGKLDEAMTHYRQALDLKPEYEAAHYKLANALALKGALADAEVHFQTALRYKPDYAEAHTKLANLLVLQGRAAEAMEHYYDAIKLNPDYQEGFYYLAATLARQKKLESAVTYLRVAIKLKPDDPVSLNDLAWILATADRPRIRDLNEAITLARRACELSRQENPKYLDTLAVAYSETRRFAEAIETTRRAVAAAETTGQKKLAEIIQGRLKFYEQGRTYLESFDKTPTANP